MSLRPTNVSRSTKKPFWADQVTEAKRQANRTFRRADKRACQEDPRAEVKSGKAYRKVTNSYDIRDYSFPDPKNPKARRK
jgi:hypothetical protein